MEAAIQVIFRRNIWPVMELHIIKINSSASQQDNVGNGHHMQQQQVNNQELRTDVRSFALARSENSRLSKNTSRFNDIESNSAATHL